MGAVGDTIKEVQQLRSGEGGNSIQRPLTRARFFVRRIFASGRSPVRSRPRPPTSSLIARACEIHLCLDPRFFVHWSEPLERDSFIMYISRDHNTSGLPVIQSLKPSFSV